ncbi:MAG: radical SAM protein [Blautia sp.]|nr:radical SAM protein [Blautia sp.]
MKEIWSQDPFLKVVLRKQRDQEDACYRWSQFVLPFTAGSRNCLYHTLTGQCLESDIIDLQNTSFFSFSQIKEDPVLHALMQDYFLVPEKKDEGAFYESIYKLRRSGLKEEGFSGYMILPVYACNARCVYCFEEGVPLVSMGKEMVEKTISFLLSSRKQNADLSLLWFGGEPLLGTPAIDRICQALQENGVTYHSGMTTNGSMITESIIRRMKELWRVKSVKVSMDPGEEEYIRRKRYLNYDHTYQRVLQNINLLQEAGIQTEVRCNVDEENADRIPEFLSDLEKHIERKAELYVGFAPLHASAAKETGLPLFERIAEAEKMSRERGFRGRSPMVLSGFRVNHCMADEFCRNVVIAPDGQLYLCDFCEKGTAIGNVRDGITRPDLVSLYNEIINTREKCRHCTFLPLCTPFSRCPIKTFHCRELQKRKTLEALKNRLCEREITC